MFRLFFHWREIDEPRGICLCYVETNWKLINWRRSLTNFSFCLHVVSALDPWARAAAGAFSRTGRIYGARPEGSLWTGVPRTPLHADAICLWRKPHAGSGPTGWVRAHAFTDGSGWQFPWYGRHGWHGAPSWQHDETQDDKCQQAYEAAAPTAAAGTAGMNKDHRVIMAHELQLSMYVTEFVFVITHLALQM